jgi:MYXO-CTERM domain-containing protein
MTHEAGHFFGLDEDMDDDASTMFYKTGKCELKKRDLEGPDRSVMTMLYESPPPAGGESATDTGAGCGGASTSGRGPASSGVAALGALVALVLLSRRRAACRAASP